MASTAAALMKLYRSIEDRPAYRQRLWLLLAADSVFDCLEDGIPARQMVAGWQGIGKIFPAILASFTDEATAEKVIAPEEMPLLTSCGRC